MIQTFFEQHYYLIGLISFLLGLILMPIVIRIAKAKGFVVRPNKRMSHEGEVPNIGGLNICISFILTYLLFNPTEPNHFFFIGLFSIMVIGFIDDVLVLRPMAKLFGETLAGIALIGFSNLRITHLHGLFSSMVWTALPAVWELSTACSSPSISVWQERRLGLFLVCV